MAKFFLRTVSNESETAKLYTRVAKPKLCVSWWICTGIEVNVAEWSKAQTSAKALFKYYSTDEGRKVQEQTQEVSELITSFFKGKKTVSNDDKQKLEESIFYTVHREEIERRKKEKEQANKISEEKREQERNRLSVIINYYEDFMQRMMSGELRQGRKNSAYKSNTMSIWRTFGKHLREYLGKRKCASMTFDDIDKRFADGFTGFLEKKELMLSTRNQQINCFRKLCNSAAEDGKNRNLHSIKVWHSHEEKDEDKRAEIVLSDEEINALYNMKLEGLREKVRDMWCLGYFCAQRVSDYSRLSRENFKVTKNGVNVIVLNQQKTGKEVIIPILDERVLELCEKYDFNFPTLTRDNQNRFIKIVAKELSEKLPSLKEWKNTLLSLKEREKEQSFKVMKERVKNGEKLNYEEAKRFRRMSAYAEEHESGENLFKRDYAGRVIRQRWEMITCHTCRRSAVTAMYDSGLYDLKDIMSVSGHETIKNVERYLKRDAISQAERIAEKARKAREIKLKREA